MTPPQQQPDEPGNAGARSALDEFYARERTRHATFGVMVFVFSALHVHVVYGGLPSLFTLDALLFLAVGVPLSAFVLGPFGFHLHRGVAGVVFRTPPVDPSPTLVRLTKLLDLVLKVVVVLIGWYLVKEAWLGVHGLA